LRGQWRRPFRRQAIRRADPFDDQQSRRNCYPVGNGHFRDDGFRPIAALLVELFPARIRYSSMSLPYHVGNGWIGGFLPTTAFAMVAATGDIYYGLWYPVSVAGASAIVGMHVSTGDVSARHKQVDAKQPVPGASGRGYTIKGKFQLETALTMWRSLVSRESR